MTKGNSDSPRVLTATPSVWRSVLFLLVAAGVLLSSLPNELVWDDLFFIAHNPDLGTPGALWTALTGSFWQNSTYRATTLTDFWRPIPSFLVAFTGILTGSSAVGFRWLAILSTVLAAIGVGRLCRAVAPDSCRREAGIAAACLYAVHPFSIEVTCMVVNISDHLVLFCITSALSLLLRCRRCGRVTPASSGVLFLLGIGACFSKEFGVLFALVPFIAGLLSLDSDSRPTRFHLFPVHTWVFCLLPSVLYLSLRQLVMATASATSLWDAIAPENPFIRLAGLGYGLFLMVVPIPTGAHFYLSTQTILPLLTGLSVMLLVAIGLISCLRRPHWRSSAFVLLLTGILLTLPALLIIPSFGDLHRFAIRYWSVAAAFSIVAGTLWLSHRSRLMGRWILPLVLVLFSLLSWIRVSQWRTHVSFVQAETESHSTSAFEWMNYAVVLLDLGRFDEAATVLTRVETAGGIDDPGLQGTAHALEADLLARGRGDYEQASERIRQAIALQPHHLGHLLDLATYRAAAGHPQEALALLRSAVRSPQYSAFQKTAIEDRILSISKPVSDATH